MSVLAMAVNTLKRSRMVGGDGCDPDVGRRGPAEPPGTVQHAVHYKEQVEVARLVHLDSNIIPNFSHFHLPS